MLKISIIQFIILFFCSLAQGQTIKEIESFSYEIKADESSLWYEILPCFKYDNDEIECKKDSILAIDPRLNDVLTFVYKYREGWLYIETNCRYEGLSKSTTDSILLYTPVKYFENRESPTISDTLMVAYYSFLLSKVQEKKIYDKDWEQDIFRFVWKHENKINVYRLEKLSNVAFVNKKLATLSDSGEWEISDSTFTISVKKYQKVVKTINNSGYWKMDTNYRFYPKDIIIESYVDNKYYFINKNWRDLQEKNKALLKVFDKIEKL